MTVWGDLKVGDVVMNRSNVWLLLKLSPDTIFSFDHIKLSLLCLNTGALVSDFWRARTDVPTTFTILRGSSTLKKGST